MPARLRNTVLRCKGAAPSLKRCCKMCEAEFANRQSLLDNIGLVHGGERWYASAVAGLVSVEPYIASTVEQRACLECFAHAQQHATLDPENAPYCDPLEPQAQRQLFYDRICEACERSTCFWRTCVQSPPVTQMKPLMETGETETERHRGTDVQRQASRQAGKRASRHAGGHAGKQVGLEAGTQAGRHARIQSSNLPGW